MDALSEYLNYFTYAPLPIFLFSLFKCWRNIGARWFLILLVTVECIDVFSYRYSINWNTHYYAWSVFISFLFYAPSFYRSRIAHKLYEKTDSSFFLEASKLKFTQQEAAILLIFFISMIANGISYIEILLYKYYIIDVYYFKLYVLDNLQLLLHVFLCLAALSFQINSRKGQKYETANT